MPELHLCSTKYADLFTPCTDTMRFSFAKQDHLDAAAATNCLSPTKMTLLPRLAVTSVVNWPKHLYLDCCHIRHKVHTSDLLDCTYDY